MKKKYEKVIITIAVLTFVFSAGMSNVQAQTDVIIPDEIGNEVRAEYILESLEDSDYDDWKRLVNPNSKLAQKVTKEVFQKFTHARELARQGRYNKALWECERVASYLDLNEKETGKIINILGLK